MIKGFRFTNQLSNAEVDARIHQEIFNKNDGIFYGMELSHTKDSITISEGLCEIAGRPVGIVGSEKISVNSESLYCLLVLEIDLSKESSVDTFNQASFKILTSSTSYPTLTQQDINRIDGTNNLYQMEFARFLTDPNGIDDLNFRDTRKLLSFDNIYEEIRQHIQDIDSGAIFIKKSDIAIIQGNINSSDTNVAINYPNGFNYQNSVILSVVAGQDNTALSTTTNKQTVPPGCTDLRVVLQSKNIVIERTKSTITPSSNTLYKLVLLKTSEEMFK